MQGRANLRRQARPGPADGCAAEPSTSSTSSRRDSDLSLSSSTKCEAGGSPLAPRPPPAAPLRSPRLPGISEAATPRLPPRGSHVASAVSLAPSRGSDASHSALSARHLGGCTLRVGAEPAFASARAAPRGGHGDDVLPSRSRPTPRPAGGRQRVVHEGAGS